MNKVCFSLSAFDGTSSGRGGSEGSLLSLPEDVDLGSTKFQVIIATILASPAIDLDVFVVSRSFGVNSLVVSAGSSAELVRCASLDKPGTTIGTKLSHVQGALLPFF